MKITDVTFRHYRDSGQSKVYVAHDQGRTEGAAHYPTGYLLPVVTNLHMTALITRAGREGVIIHGETW
jgi:hypothetical protein